VAAERGGDRLTFKTVAIVLNPNAAVWRANPCKGVRQARPIPASVKRRLLKNA
jgi:hypothetical protein